MTATYGKLDHQTLMLKPGMNIVQAPNEWGKSTWCSFLIAMLYGLETRAKSTKTTLADKERYAPWSGKSMEGRIDLNWNGRDITIERKTRGRIPLGQFSAYETASGLPVPELTAANCGETLLGVERSVFLRSGFIRFSDLPVTQDETLRRRLNSLVTTGDESGDADKLAGGLKELKNRVRYNRTGLLPQAEGRRTELEGKLRELEDLENQSDKLSQRLVQVQDWERQLVNHKGHLQYRAAQADAERVAQAEKTCREARQRLEAAEAACVGLEPRDQLELSVAHLGKLSREMADIRMEEQMLPQPPKEPDPPAVFRGMTGAEARERALADGVQYEQLQKKQPLFLILGLVAVIAGVAAIFRWPIPGILCAALGVGLSCVWLVDHARKAERRMQLEGNYGNTDPENWRDMAEMWAGTLEENDRAWQQFRESGQDLRQRSQAVLKKIADCTDGYPPEEARDRWEAGVAAWEALANARREAVRAEQYAVTLGEMIRKAECPSMPDMLEYSENETTRLLSDAGVEKSQLQSRLNQYRGRMEALGDREELRRKLDEVGSRIGKLEDIYAALTIAQQALSDAALELQRRFAPRISRRAQELMAAFTGGRYDRLALGEDLGLRAGAQAEDTLHGSLWRSDGTVDQLYLALRLAVAEALTPEAPLILDDALVRFDDSRLACTLDVLKQVARDRQVILFTCQSREKELCQV